MPGSGNKLAIENRWLNNQGTRVSVDRVAQPPPLVTGRRALPLGPGWGAVSLKEMGPPHWVKE